MTVLISIAITLALFIALFAFKVAIYPQIKMNYYKRKYGDQIETIFNYSSGVLMEYRKCLQKDDDSLSTFRKISKENPNVKVILHNNSRGKIAYSFIDPELIKQVHQQHEHFTKEITNPAILFLFSKSILFSSGKDWQKQRQFLGKSFNFDEIKNFLPSIKDITKSVFQKISNKLKSIPQQEIEVVKICEKITSEVVFQVFFGSTSQNLIIDRPDGSKIPVAQELIQVITDTFRLVQYSKLSFLKLMLFRAKCFSTLPLKGEKEIMHRLNNLKSVCDSVVQQRKRYLICDPSQYKNNFLDLYLKEIILNKNQDIKEESIVDNFLGLFFAGTDTTGNMTGAALYFLSKHPQIQQKARDEVFNILSQKKNLSSNADELYNSMNFEDITNMNFINSVLKETLRIIPPAAIVFPRQVIKDIKIGNFQLEKGDLVNTNFLCNQSNPQIFQNPEEFDPERWLNTKEQIYYKKIQISINFYQKRSFQFNFTPFSLGPRNCIGQHLAMIEGKCILAYVLLNFDIIPNNAQKLKKEIKIIYGVSPDNLVIFKQRTHI